MSLDKPALLDLPELIISNYDLMHGFRTLGMKELLENLVGSHEFNISFHKEHLSAMRSAMATTLYYNGKKIFLDLWEYSTPTYTMEVYNAKFDLIIKLQHGVTAPDAFNACCEKKKMLIGLSKEERNAFVKKIVTWTFFCSKIMKPFIGKEEDFPQLPIKQIGFFCGKGWRCRNLMFDKLSKSNIEIYRSDQGQVDGKKLTDEQFVEKMLTSKYGIVLHGRHGPFAEPKNRREIDYMMMKKPLLLDYKPHYYNPLIEGYHYIYINEKTDINTIEKLYNIDEIAQNGYQWYKDNASPKGVVKVFKQIMRDKFKS